MSRFA